MTEHWTAVHDLALLYVACAYRGDREMDDVERQSVVTMLLLRFPDIDRDHASTVVDRVLLTYLSDARGDLLSAAITTLRDSLSRSERAKVLDELTGIASSDGVILPGEVDFISQIARTWQLRGPRTDS